MNIIMMQLITWNLFLALQVVKYFRLFQILKNTFQLNFKDQTQDSIDQIESSNKHKTKIPKTSRKENIIYIPPRMHLIIVDSCSRRLEVGRNPDELLVASLQASVDQLSENEWGLLLRLLFDAQVSKSIKFCISSEYVKKQVEILPGVVVYL